jgi:class 3 adenylate cyclase/TolB-like protein
MERVHLKRKLTAVLLADVVGYSRLMSVDEEGTHIRLADCVKSVIEPTVVLHEGRLVRSKGDGLLVEFDSAVNAVNCAVDIQLGLATHDDAAGDRKLQLRIGINSGDVIVQENDVYGNSVNIAARLEGLAEPGGISVTAAVREQLLGHPGLFFEDTGDRWVKNIDRPIRVYRVTSAPSQESRDCADTPGIFGRRFAGRKFRPSRATIFSVGAVAMVTTIGIAGLPTLHRLPLLSSQASVMVLPFRNLNGPGDDYFADAVTDELTTDLSRLADTIVIARATAFTYKDKPVDTREIRREFGVRYILAGSIQRIGTRVQANAELIDTSSASSLWAERFQSELTDPFELQEAVTGRIAASLHLQLVRVESRRSLAERTTDPDAYDMRLRAKAYLIDKLSPQNTLAARRELEKATALDPNSAETWAALAHVLMIDFLRTWNNATMEVVVRAEEAVQKAYAIDRSVALAHVAEGKIREVKGDLQGEIDALNEALQLDPNLSVAYAHKANTLILLGRAQEAPELLTKAIRLSPRDPELGLFYWFMGRAYFNAKNYKDAIQWLQKSVQERPTTWFSWAHLISAYALTERLGEPDAKAALDAYRQRFTADWPFDPNIKDYYTQAKYRSAAPQLQASLQEYFRGLESAKGTAGFP